MASATPNAVPSREKSPPAAVPMVPAITMMPPTRNPRERTMRRSLGNMIAAPIATHTICTRSPNVSKPGSIW